MQALVVPKNRKPKFELYLKVFDFNNVPYNSGRLSVKWHLAHATHEHRGTTDKVALENHIATWNYETQIPVRLVVEKTGMLQDSYIYFEVFHESDGLKSKLDRTGLGTRKLNLAEYVEASELAHDDGVCQRYLLHDSKINSTIKIGINMKLIEGDRNFIAPPLKSQQVFGGIAGIMAGDQANADPADDVPMLSAKVREAGEDLRELYRRTLAADWTNRPGEPSADFCIENIFAGGDGWGNREGQEHTSVHHRTDDSGHLSDSTHTLRGSKPHAWNGFFNRRGHEKKRSTHEVSDRDDGSLLFRDAGRSVRGQGSFEHSAAQRKANINRRSLLSGEVDELGHREDLQCWKLDKYSQKDHFTG